MTKKKINLRQRVIHWFTYHPWLKLVALVLAVMVWFYVGGELQQFNY